MAMGRRPTDEGDEGLLSAEGQDMVTVAVFVVSLPGEGLISREVAILEHRWAGGLWHGKAVVEKAKEP
jgi:hypothetical protein